jgi:uncharacterized protein
MTTPTVGRLWRYPVKSMGGEEVDELIVGQGNVIGDRAYGFIETRNAKLVSAKRHAALVGCRARFTEPPTGDESTPPIEVTFPDGTVVTDDGDELSRRVSALLGHEVRLVNHNDPAAESVVAWGAPKTLADFAPLHVLATSELDRLAAEHHEGEWDPRRFRPNVLIEDTARPTASDSWLAYDLHFGAEVVVHVVMPTPRCVMTTLSQGSLPKDRDILRTLVRASTKQVRAFGDRPAVGYYAQIVRPGVVRTGDPVRAEKVQPRDGALVTALDAFAARGGSA